MRQCDSDSGSGHTIFRINGSVTQNSCAGTSGDSAGDGLSVYRSAGGRSIRDGDSIPFKRKRCKMARDFRIWLICRAVISAQCRPGRADLSSNAMQALYLT